jgi:hypothetical protein
MREAGREGRGLAKVAAEADDAQPGIGGLQCGQLRKRVIGRPVVDHDHFEAASAAGKRAHHLVVQRPDVGRLVADGNDD